MKVISSFSRLPATRKILLIAGIVMLLISTCLVYPIERSKTNFLEEFVYTFSTLAFALFLLMAGLTGKHFLKGILFLIASSFIGAVLFYLVYPPFRFAAFIAVWLGIPSGLTAALVFMILNYFFFSKVKSYKVIKQTLLYLTILFIVAVLFGYGGDWLFEITQYLKNQ